MLRMLFWDTVYIERIWKPLVLSNEIWTVVLQPVLCAVYAGAPYCWKMNLVGNRWFQSSTSNLSKAHETRDSFCSSISHILLVCLQPFHRNSRCWKSQKNTETLYFGGLRSFNIISVDTAKNSSPVLVMINSMSMSVCNCFHVRRANISKINAFWRERRSPWA